ncbi:MAG: hypothetical protein NTX50_03800 [Candidatus Sumerlaeota bacterium]|nr:hypothetical protein [Candidatus Sumerlaeota bacterium]
MLGQLEALIRLHELRKQGTEGKKQSRRQVTEIERCKLELPPQLIDRHEYLVKRYGAGAIAPIKNGCCSGCYVHMPSSRKNMIEENIYVCEQCGRLLYDEAKVYDLVA